MINIHLKWETNPCGKQPDYYALFWRREFIDDAGINQSNYSAKEIVLGGQLLATGLTETSYIHLAIGRGNSYAVIAHSGDDISQPAIVASNIDANTETAIIDGEATWVREVDGEMVPVSDPTGSL
jgi:hypothetical protein